MTGVVPDENWIKCVNSVVSDRQRRHQKQTAIRHPNVNTQTNQQVVGILHENLEDNCSKVLLTVLDCIHLPDRKKSWFVKLTGDQQASFELSQSGSMSMLSLMFSDSTNQQTIQDLIDAESWVSPIRAYKVPCGLFICGNDLQVTLDDDTPAEKYCTLYVPFQHPDLEVSAACLIDGPTESLMKGDLVTATYRGNCGYQVSPKGVGGELPTGQTSLICFVVDSIFCDTETGIVDLFVIWTAHSIEDQDPIGVDENGLINVTPDCRIAGVTKDQLENASGSATLIYPRSGADPYYKLTTICYPEDTCDDVIEVNP